MWLVWSCIAIVLFALCEIYEKKGSSIKEECSELKIIIWFGIFGFIVALAIKTFGLRESNTSFFVMACENKLLIINAGLYCLALFMAFISLKFIPLVIEVPITNTDGIFCFIGAVLLYAIRGNFEEIRSEVTIPKVILVTIILIVVIVFSILHYNNFKKDKDNFVGKLLNSVSGSKIKLVTFVIFGILCAFLSAILDASHSVIIYYILDEVVDSFDFIYFNNILYGIIGILIYIYILIKYKKFYNPFKKSEYNRMMGACLDCIGNIATVLAVNINPFWADPIISTYFVFTVFLSSILLKEKLKMNQYVCVILLSLCIIAFAIFDR